jgi:hypothetical protein
LTMGNSSSFPTQLNKMSFSVCLQHRISKRFSYFLSAFLIRQRQNSHSVITLL